MTFLEDDKPITADKLREFDKCLLVDYHGDEIDEPYEGAGFCVCFICQDIAPRIMAAAERIDELEAENVRLREALRPFADFCAEDAPITLNQIYIAANTYDGEVAE